jgi:hypothetical protein
MTPMPTSRDTEAALRDPRPGDLFIEWGAYQALVVARDGERVTWLAGPLARDWTRVASRHFGTCAEFRRMHSHDDGCPSVALYGTVSAARA